jgi:hypothetical protein
VPHFLDPLHGGAGVPDLSRIPGGQSFSLGLGDGPERLVPNLYRLTSVPGWPWLADQQTPRFY